MPWLVLTARIGLIGVERVLLKGLGRDAGSLSATFLFFSLACLMLTPWGVAHPLPPRALATAVGSGVLFAAAFVFFVRALSLGDISKVTPLSGLSHLVVLGLAVALGTEPVGAPQILGTLLILAGVARLQGSGWGALRGLWHDRASQAMLAYAVSLALERLVDQQGGPQAHVLAYTWTMFLTVTLVLAVLLTWRRQWPGAFALFRARPGIALASAGTNALTYASLVALLDEFPLTVMEPLTSLSYLVSAYLGAWFYGEDLRGRILPAVVVAAGSGLVLWR